VTATDFDRTPPHHIEAEQCALGGMLLSADAIADVTEIITPADHYRPAHQVIHEAILAVQERGEPVDAVTVADLLARQGDLMRAGGGPYLHTLIASVPSAANAGYHARIVRERAILRRLIEAGTRVAQLGYEGAGEAADIAARAQQMVENAAAPLRASSLQDLDDLLYEVIGSLEHKAERGIPTPWADLNDLIGGLAPGELVLMAARAGVGKSIGCLGIAAHAALRLHLPVLFASMEMTRQEIMLRLIAAEGRVPLTALVTREMTSYHWDRVDAARKRIEGAPLVIDDTPGCSLAHLRSRLRAMARTAPAALLVVDYLQLLTEPARSENRQAAVAALSRGLKLLAGEQHIPVVAAAQLNRQPEHRHDRRPQASDLRESGALEADASVVVLLHRPDMHDPESGRAGEIDFIVDKNRSGPRDTVTLFFQGDYARCVDPEWTPSGVLAGAR